MRTICFEMWLGKRQGNAKFALKSYDWHFDNESFFRYCRDWYRWDIEAVWKRIQEKIA